MVKNHRLIAPIGIDSEIDRIQVKLYQSLSEKWGNLEGYGRVYKNIDGKTFKPEYFVSNKAYKDVLPGRNSKFFFIKGDTTTDGSASRYVTSNVSVYFFVNLRSFSEDQRMDEQAVIDAYGVLSKTRFKATDILQGVENFLSDFKMLLAANENNLSVTDLHPYHVFKIKGAISYYLKSKC